MDNTNLGENAPNFAADAVHKHNMKYTNVPNKWQTLRDDVSCHLVCTESPEN